MTRWISWVAAVAAVLALCAGLRAGLLDGMVSPAVAQSQTGGDPAVNGSLLILPPDDYVIKFNVPIGIGPVPVNGQSIAQLIEGKPLFPPIEGLDKSLWEKTCSSCHKWNRETLCDQGKTYAGLNTRLVLRHSHPYGGPFKLALKRWAEQGCQ